MEFQTYLKDCNCANSGTILYQNKIHCRWCRKPYAEGGMMHYKTEHFTPTVESDFEILSFKDEYGTIINWQGEDRHSGYTYKGWCEGCLSFNYTIHSVRRLSDNSVWTVTEKTKYGTIESFYISADKWMNVHFTNGCGATLSSLDKSPPKQKLFTTEDKVVVYEGDDYLLHLVDNKFGVWSNTAKFCAGDDPNTKYFYYLKNRTNYILKNKPILISLNEIQGVINKVADGAEGHDNKMYLRDKFYEIFKSKINQP